MWISCAKRLGLNSDAARVARLKPLHRTKTSRRGSEGRIRGIGFIRGM